MHYNTNDFLSIAVDAAILAGDKIMEVYGQHSIEIEWKTDNSPLTIADKAAHVTIYEKLQQTAIPILSEEGKETDYAIRKNWETYWLVDPLDGTKEFIHRNGEFTVNIALISKQHPVLGVIYVPVTKVLYFATEKGSYKTVISGSSIENEIKNALRLPLTSTRNKFVVVGSRSHKTLETEQFIAMLDKKGKELEFKAIGSSLKICLVAEGAADVYPRMGPTMEWDTAAGHAIARFAGKTVNVYPGGETLCYNKENLLNPWFIVN
jgi:3'(2'), 5'-bisphosphate nucleotidase